MKEQNTYPRTFSHIGITVPDITAAVSFYENVMGWYVIMPPSLVKKEKETAIGQMCIDVFGEDWETFEIAHLSTSDGVGIELFSFPETPKNKPEFNPFSPGLFHFCVQDPNIESLIEKIISHGGKQRMPIRAYYPDNKPYKMCYVEDPFGVVFEIYTHSYELTYSSGAYADM
ncbi:glyoxalase [Croceivirga radicis]|uniref:Glyoxalase n=1 Tax=Croceivirga radicis TaxID=1929488 RepID=A0A1V6LU27_9FLAO|nr:VOC family protein [Croceivirga radicis]OQD43685.1 glyoxalase [Croceivirga radicis]